MRRAATIGLTTTCLLLAPSLARGQATSGGELRANTYTSGDQSDPTAAIDVLTSSMVFWRSATQDAGTAGIYCQRFKQGSPVGVEFRVNSYTTGDQGFPAAATGGGHFVVLWQDDGGEDGSGSGIFGQRYDLGGPAGSEFRVTVWTTGNQTHPMVGKNNAGGFVVTWSGAGPGDADGIWARGFNGTGTVATGDLRMNTYTTGLQSNPSVALTIGSGFSYLVVWESAGQDGAGPSIYAQRADIAAGPQGAEFRVNAATGTPQDSPSIANSANGTGHVVTWRRVNTASTDYDIVGRFYDGTLAPVGAEFRVNGHSGRHEHPSVAMDGARNFVIAWTDYEGLDGDAAGVFVRRYASGVPVGTELHINATTTGSQTRARAATYTQGDFRLVWMSQPQDGSGQGIYTQLYCRSVAGDANGDGTVSVADILYLINHLFAGGPSPVNSGDANGDGSLNVQDVLFLINYLFAGGAPPVCLAV